MSNPPNQSFVITGSGLVAKDWDGVTDRNGDGDLSFAGDFKKSFEITRSNIVYFDEITGSPSIIIDVTGTQLL